MTGFIGLATLKKDEGRPRANILWPRFFSNSLIYRDETPLCNTKHVEKIWKNADLHCGIPCLKAGWFQCLSRHIAWRDKGQGKHCEPFFPIQFVKWPQPNNKIILRYQYVRCINKTSTIVFIMLFVMKRTWLCISSTIINIVSLFIHVISFPTDLLCWWCGSVEK